MIGQFADELRRRVQARDPAAVVKIMSTPKTMIDGEYIAVIESGIGEVEVYVFNPNTKSWIICYQV